MPTTPNVSGDSPTRSRLMFWLSILIPPLVPVMLVVAAAIDPAIAHRMTAKEKGIVEHLTVLVLIPAILAGLWGAWVAHRHKLTPKWWLPGWFVMWSLACLYFAGEEISWGQHYFGWEAPESISQINDQQETNLHNMSSWLDQKPRTLVEIFIVVAGLVMPVVHRVQGRRRFNPARWDAWIWPSAFCSTAAAMMLVCRLGEELEGSMPDLMAGLASSEAREYAIALFLTMYLGEWALRVRQARRRPAAATPESA